MRLCEGLVPSLHIDWGHISGFGWTMFAQIALLSGVISFLCFYKGVQQAGASGATLIMASINAAFPRGRRSTPRSRVAARAAAVSRATTERGRGASRPQTRG